MFSIFLKKDSTFHYIDTLQEDCQNEKINTSLQTFNKENREKDASG